MISWNTLRSGPTRRPAAAVLLILGNVLVHPRAEAQENAPLDSLVRAFMAEHDAPGLVVGITGPAGDRIHGYGVSSRETGEPVDSTTRFEVGSIAKVFTALLLAEKATRGELALEDPLSAHLPPGIAAPAHDGREITLRQLAEHTSGLPRLPTNLVPADLADPYAGYTAEALYAFLNDHRLARAPGSQYEYSNLGAGLLGHLIAGGGEARYGAVLRARILDPLGLGSTYVPEPGSVDERMAQGYAGGSPVPYWRFGPLAGAGEVRSSAADLLRFLRAQLDSVSSPLDDAIRLSQEIGAEAAPNVRMALGWHVAELARGAPLYFHNGGTGGFRSFAAFLPDRGLALVILANAAAPLQAVDQLALQVLLAAMRD